MRNPVHTKRVSQRAVEGGQDVPMAKQVERLRRSLANGRVAHEIAGLSLVVDNGQPRGNRAYAHELIAVFLGSHPVEVMLPPPKWAGIILPCV